MGFLANRFYALPIMVTVARVLWYLKPPPVYVHYILPYLHLRATVAHLASLP